MITLKFQMQSFVIVELNDLHEFVYEMNYEIQYSSRKKYY